MVKMCTLIFVVVVLAIANAASPFESASVRSWIDFKKTHEKYYSTIEEEELRYGLFTDTLKRINEHNAKHEGSLVLGINQFADMTEKELGGLNGFNMTMHREFRERRKLKNLNKVFTTTTTEDEIPESVDWRESGAVSRVKDQGQCFSCWAFSATGALEAQEFFKTGILEELSEQNLVDCSKKNGNKGCGGGIMDIAFEYVEFNKGIDSEKSYPYEARDDRGCRYEDENSAMTDDGFVDIPEGDEEKLKIAVATVGPISVGIDAELSSFTSYSKGIYYDSNCSSTNLNHGVLVVGYGTENGQDYWLVKNSWNESWGDKGYIKMARNRDNNCGIATAASFPMVKGVKPKRIYDDNDYNDSDKDHLGNLILSKEPVKLKSITQERTVYEFAKKR